MVLPKLLRGVLARHALQDLGAAGVFCAFLLASCVSGTLLRPDYEEGGGGRRRTVYEFSDVIHAVVDDDVHALAWRVVRSDFGGCDCLGHFFPSWGFGRVEIRGRGWTKRLGSSDGRRFGGLRGRERLGWVLELSV